MTPFISKTTEWGSNIFAHASECDMRLFSSLQRVKYHRPLRASASLPYFPPLHHGDRTLPGRAEDSVSGVGVGEGKGGHNQHKLNQHKHNAHTTRTQHEHNTNTTQTEIRSHPSQTHCLIAACAQSYPAIRDISSHTFLLGAVHEKAKLSLGTELFLK